MEPKATMGQKRILQFAARANRRLRGRRASDGTVAYRIVELSSLPWEPARFVQDVHPRMVKQLQDAGWIVVATGDKTDWEYRVTDEGIIAANS